MIITIWRLPFSWKGRNEKRKFGKVVKGKKSWRRESGKESNFSKARGDPKQEESAGSPPTVCVEGCYLLFGIWGRRQRQRLAEEEDRKGERGGVKKRSRFTLWCRSWAPCKNSPGYVRHLERRVTSSVCPVLKRGCPMLLCSLPLVYQHSEGPLEATPVWTRLALKGRTCRRTLHPAWERDPRSTPLSTWHFLHGIWAGKKQRQLQSSAELSGGCSYSLIWQQSWEIIWISLVSVACLSGFSADWVQSCMFSVPAVWAWECVGAVCGLICLFCHSWFLFSCCLHAAFLFRSERRTCVGG